MISGPALFCRFAFPPNLLGYCGTPENLLIGELLADGEAVDEMRHIASTFDGAWPYLELIAETTGRDPLDYKVVEAYWLGNPLLERIDLQTMGNSIADRFHARAGLEWPMIAGSLGPPARPTHSFHVFCVYPWVGMLRSGAVDQALSVLDRCRIRWGTVASAENDALTVFTQPLTWDGRLLGLGPETLERVRPPLDDPSIRPGDRVAMHWDYVCQRISDSQLRSLERYQKLYIGLTNRTGRRLSKRVEG